MMQKLSNTHSGVPMFAYFAYDHYSRLSLYLRFETKFGARKGVRALIDRFAERDIATEITYSGTEETRGVFEVELTFVDGTDEDEVLQALKPPCSNRGVTK